MIKVFFLLAILFLHFNSSAQSTLEAYWDDGLKFRSKDGTYQFSVGGRVHYDLAFINHDSDLDSAFGMSRSTTEVRRARISFEGLIANKFQFEFEFTFNEQVEFADMYLAFLQVPIFDKLTVGYFREPFGIEELTSSNAIIFMERALTSTFGRGRNTGIMLQKGFPDNKVNIYSGIFRQTDDLGADLEGNNKVSFSNRFVYTPIINRERNKTLHTGLTWNIFQPLKNELIYRAASETNTGPRYINTGIIGNVKKVYQLGTEFGYSNNAFNLQSEFINSTAHKNLNVSTVQKMNFNSYYVALSYFLKGGKRSYSSGGNRFSTVTLDKSGNKKYSGAWELGLRYSGIDVNGWGQQFQKMNDITLGVNWYFNNTSRFMFNYIFTKLDNSFKASSFQFRTQVTF